MIIRNSEEIFGTLQGVVCDRIQSISLEASLNFIVFMHNC